MYIYVYIYIYSYIYTYIVYIYLFVKATDMVNCAQLIMQYKSIAPSTHITEKQIVKEVARSVHYAYRDKKSVWPEGRVVCHNSWQMARQRPTCMSGPQNAILRKEGR